jgi:hypothetical protein
MTFWQSFKAQAKTDFEPSKAKALGISFEMLWLAMLFVVSSWAWKAYHDFSLGVLSTLLFQTAYSWAMIIFTNTKAVWKNAKAASQSGT